MLRVVHRCRAAAAKLFDATRYGTTPADQDIKVLLVGFITGEGGAAVLLREMACRMTELGVAVKIIVPASKTTEVYAEQCRKRGLSVELTELLSVRTAASARLLQPLREYGAALRFLHKNRVPIVHFHLGATNALSHYLLRAMKLLRFPPVFVTPHNNVDDPHPDSAWARYWAMAAPRRVSKIICISESGRRRQLEYGIADEQTQLIANGIKLRLYANGNPYIARRSLGIEENAPLIMFTGRIEQQKRPLDALTAFQLISAKFQDAHLVFVGQGSLAERTKVEALDAGLGDRVHFSGFVSNVADWLAASTVWLLPTESEGSSLAVLEAMAARCAIVTTDCPGNNEIIVNEDNGLLTKIADVESIAEALERLLSDKALRTRLGDSAYVTAQQFDLEKMVREHLVCYAEVAPNAFFVPNLFDEGKDVNARNG